MSTYSPYKSAQATNKQEVPDGWQETRAQTALATQFVNEEDYLATTKQDIGRVTSAGVHELFVSCDPAEAVQQQFEHLQTDFIAVHDLATASSRKLLIGVAAASGRTLQKLIIRRQGFGTPLASIEFVELPAANDTVLRMYSTEADADTAARHGLARVLLGFSRLAVIMVGDLPSHAIESALKPIRDAMAGGAWPNRQMLLLPLAAASTLVSHGIELSQGTGVNVRTTPQVTRPADAWSFITASWSRLGEEPQPAGRSVTGLRPLTRDAPSNGRAPTVPPAKGALNPTPPKPLGMRPMPSVPSAQDRSPLPEAEVLERYLRQVSELTGILSCCIFEAASGREVAHAGASPGATPLALHGTQLLAAMSTASRALGLGHDLPEAAITLAGHHLLLREVPRHPRLALHAVLDKTTANLTLVRLQIQRMDALFGASTKV